MHEDFVKLVLGFIKKRGDNREHREAHRLLGEFEEFEGQRASAVDVAQHPISEVLPTGDGEQAGEGQQNGEGWKDLDEE